MRWASTFGVTIDESWASLPETEVIVRQLEDWGILDDGMTVE